MNKFLLTTIALFSLFGSAIIAMGQQPPPPQDMPRAVTAQSISGTIKNLDFSTNQVTLETADKHEVTFTFDEQTKVTKDGEPCTPAELKEDQKIRADLQESMAILIAVSG